MRFVGKDNFVDIPSKLLGFQQRVGHSIKKNAQKLFQVRSHQWDIESESFRASLLSSFWEASARYEGLDGTEKLRSLQLNYDLRDKVGSELDAGVPIMKVTTKGQVLGTVGMVKLIEYRSKHDI